MTDMNIENATAEQLGAQITAQRGHVQALAFVAKGGTGLSSCLHNIWVAKSLERQGKLSVFVFLLNNYSEDERAGIPVVGSKKGESGNKPYDRYTTQVKTDTGMKSVPGSWYTDAIRATAESKWIDTVASWCDGNEEHRPDNIPADVKEPKTVRASEFKAEMLKARQDMRAGLVGGCQLYLHSEEISAINPDRIRVKMPIRKDAETGNLVLGGSNMVRLVDPMEGGEDERILTVSEFLALDPAKLKGPGRDQTIKTLMDTKARKPRGSGTGAAGKGAQDIKPPTTVEPFLNLCNVMATALDNGTEQGKTLETQLLAKLAAKDSDDTVMTVGTVCLAFDNLWTLIQDRYTAIAAKRAAAMNDKARLERKAG